MTRNAWVLPLPLLLLSLDAACVPQDDAGSGDVAAALSPSAPRTAIINANSNKCVDDANQSTSSGTAIIQWDCTGADNQTWGVQAHSDGTVSLVNLHSSLCLMVASSPKAARGKLVQSTCTGSSAQRFTLHPQSSGSYTLVAAVSGLCVDVPGASTSDGVQLQQYSCNGTGAQAFALPGLTTSAPDLGSVASSPPDAGMSTGTTGGTMTGTIGTTGTSTGTQARRAYDFVDSIGVNTHLNWTTDPAYYADFAAVKSAMTYLGIRHIRDAVPQGSVVDHFGQLAAQGVGIDSIIVGPGEDVASVLTGRVASLATFEAAHPGGIFSVEGPNEINGNDVYYEGVDFRNDGALGATAMKAIVSAIRGNATIASTRLLNLSLWLGPNNNAASFAQAQGDQSAILDGGNVHMYPNRGAQPLASSQSSFAIAVENVPGKAPEATEAGYFTAYQQDTAFGGVSEPVQAKLILNLLADNYAVGFVRTYLYELMEQTTLVGNTWGNLTDASFGLFHEGGATKPAAVAIHNLVAALADSSTAFTPALLSYSLDSGARSILLQKSTGTFELLAWNEPTVWNPTTLVAVDPGVTDAHLHLGRAYGSVTVIDPVTGTTVATASNASDVTVPLRGSVVVVEIHD